MLVEDGPQSSPCAVTSIIQGRCLNDFVSGQRMGLGAVTIFNAFSRLKRLRILVGAVDNFDIKFLKNLYKFFKGL